MMHNEIIDGDALTVLRSLPTGHVQTVVTSPPYYGLRDYGVDGQIGLEETPAAYVTKLVEVFREVRRVLRDDGTCWLNLGDSYAGSWGNYAPKGIKGTQRPRTEDGKRWERGAYGDTSFLPPTANAPGFKPKDLMMIPARVAIALCDDGWYLRSDIIWHKTNAMPESVKDRPTKAHEYVFLLSKQERYYYDADSIREDHSCTSGWSKQRAQGIDNASNVYQSSRGPGGNKYQLEDNPAGRNKRSVWSISTVPFPGAHFAVMAPKLAETCILAGSRPGDIVLDPFSGAGTTAFVANRLGRRYLGIELNPTYADMSRERLAQLALEVAG